jgi:phage/plasmid primase-like uncharacterized protein
VGPEADRAKIAKWEPKHQAAATLEPRAENLLSVATSIRERWPDKTIVIAGDDDHRLETNPGRTKALEAAAINGVAIFPKLSGEQREQGMTDFNDLGRENPEVVARQLEETVNEARQGMTMRREHARSMELAR